MRWKNEKKINKIVLEEWGEQWEEGGTVEKQENKKTEEKRRILPRMDLW